MIPDDDDSDDGGYKKRKAKQGDAAYAAYIASHDPSSNIALQPKTSENDNDRKTNKSIESDKKPAAKVRDSY